MVCMCNQLHVSNPVRKYISAVRIPMSLYFHNNTRDGILTIFSFSWQSVMINCLIWPCQGTWPHHMTLSRDLWWRSDLFSFLRVPLTLFYHCLAQLVVLADNTFIGFQTLLKSMRTFQHYIFEFWIPWFWRRHFAPFLHDRVHLLHLSNYKAHSYGQWRVYMNRSLFMPQSQINAILHDKFRLWIRPVHK